MKKGYIYVIINHINGKYYYGKTFNIKARWKKHIIDATNKINRHLYDSMNCYGYDNFSIHIIKEILESKELITKKLNDVERYFIKISDARNPLFGYNMTDGGDGGDLITDHPNRKLIIEKQRNSNKGKKRSSEICKKFSEIQQNIQSNLSIEEKKKRANNILKSRKTRIKESGYTEKEIEAHKKFIDKTTEYNKSTEGRKRVSKQFKGKTPPPFSEEHRKNIGKASKGRLIPGKSIIVMTITYDSLHEASRKLNIPLNTIRYRLMSKNFKDWYYL
jgi:group I intron endonuclease